MAGKLSQLLFERAKESIPGGVNSPARSFKAVGGEPVIAASGSGSKLTDVDGNIYVDYLMSWGALMLGHSHPDVVSALTQVAAQGTGFGLSSEPEIVLAELIRKALPSIDLLRLVNSGTEAVMSAIRLARAFTGRDKILKFEGCYHGHSDGLLAKAGSGVATLAIPDSAGVPQAIAAQTLVAPYNDLDAVRAMTEKYGKELACIIVEPVAANMGVVPPAEGFLEGLRNIADDIAAILIFDEVITGFRVGPGGAQEKYGIKADLTTLGKIIGGGLPVGAFGGRREIMECLAPLGAVYQAGTLSGNPAVASAGAAVLKKLADADPYDKLEQRAAQLQRELAEAFASAGETVQINRVGSMFTVFFSDAPVTDYTSAKKSDSRRYASVFRAMLERGVLFAPSQFEACFLSTAHSDADIQRTAELCRQSLQEGCLSDI
ncbi:MAG: glutamate-1-semialdehyde 2,1-aminomutase [Planctomycetia bacterium]|nr:glutamate-1-semialdehyde 2,1-aminomutase [Planctomycetia bacterium]